MLAIIHTVPKKWKNVDASNIPELCALVEKGTMVTMNGKCHVYNSAPIKRELENAPKLQPITAVEEVTK